MTLTELRYLVTLARLRHFGRAAEACHVSQPTLSIAIRKLEDTLGIILFERHRHELILTPAGAGVIDQAQRVLEEADRLMGLAQAAKDEFANPLRLGAIFTVGPYIFPPLITALREARPGLMLYLEENYTHVLAEKLRNGELDVILIATPFDAPETRTLPLYSESFLLLMPREHRFSQKEVIDESELKTIAPLLLGEGHCFRDQVLAACPTADTQLPTAGSLETLRHMVALGLGLSLIPATAAELLAGADNAVVTRQISHAPSRQIIAAVRRRFPRPRALSCLLDTLQGLAMPGAAHTS